MTLVDQARAVRAGDEFDAKQVAAYLGLLDPTLVGLPAVEQFPGGASNLTYLLRYEKREFVLRRPPFGRKAKGAHDVVREARLMAALKPVYPYVPTVVAICDDPTVIGSDFFVMERLHGIIARKDLPQGLTLDPGQTRALCLEVLDRLIALHQVDCQAAGLAQLGRGEGYTERQITGWSERFRRARTEDVGDFEPVMAWLKAHMPSRDVASSLIHNDYRFDNVVLDAGDPLRVIGVLDWEMATVGDPWMDLGNTLAYWVEAGDDAMSQQMRRQPTHVPGMLSRREVIDYYVERTGYRVDNVDFYTLYGLFRLAAIAQQIHYRFFHRQTDNPEFASFGDMVRYLDRRCTALIG